MEDDFLLAVTSGETLGPADSLSRQLSAQPEGAFERAEEVHVSGGLL
jgi:hypothetical protein